MRALGDHYVLDGHQPLLCPDHAVWADWCRWADCVVGRHALNGAEILTTFLGLDHNVSPSGPPILFETMVFGGVHHGYQRRYTCWSEAEAGHTATVLMVAESDPCGSAS